VTAWGAGNMTRRRWWLLSGLVVALFAIGTVSAAFVIQNSTGAAGGVQNGSAFLAHWQQTGVVSSATPVPVPAALSTVAATPTRLPNGAIPYRMDAAARGDPAVEWIFSETTGIAVNQEIEIDFDVEFTLGGATHTATGSVYLESQAAAIGAALTFDLYWDSGAATGITFVSESQISQACAAVGTCP
jgi:hypothetical protein